MTRFEQFPAEEILGIINVNNNAKLHISHRGTTDTLIVKARHGETFQTQKAPVEGRSGCFYLYIYSSDGTADGGGNTHNSMVGEVDGEMIQTGTGRGNTYNEMRGTVRGKLMQIGSVGGGKPQIELIAPLHRVLWVWDYGMSDWVQTH